MTKHFAAVDLGASSGRVVVGSVIEDRLHYEAIHRFDNEPVATPDGLYWDVLRLYREVLVGLRLAGQPASIGIDSWAVDYGLLDADGRLLGNPLHYRDERTSGIAELVHANVPAAEFYARTGLQFLPFNTVYQLAAAHSTAQLAAARSLLLIPDLLGYWLTGNRATELTNASTTQLLDANTRSWADDLIERTGLDRNLFGQLQQPGTARGQLSPEVAKAVGGTAEVITVGSHDTASAVVAVPAESNRFAYISSGTWSLVGVELDRPVLTEASRLANFSNEAGVDGTVRYLRNVMGLWLLQESIRGWRASGLQVELARLLAEAADVPARRCLIDCDAPEFLPPGDMPARIAQAAVGQSVPGRPAEFVRCILDSLALAYRRAVRQAAELSGVEVGTIHLVGGGSQNALLCQLTADACGLPVIAGPVEASAIGNLLVQARAAGDVTGGLDALRAVVRRSGSLREYRPDPGERRAWDRIESGGSQNASQR
jgi:rhamnulokinase